MPDKAADYDQYWAYLSNAIEYILTDTKTELSFVDYTNIITVVFNYYINKEARRRRAGPHGRCILLSKTTFSLVSFISSPHGIRT
jgi:hypothetical protein